MRFDGNMHRFARVAAGGLIWTIALAAGGRLLTAQRGAGRSTSSELLSYFLRSPSHLRIEFPYPILIEVGDEVHLEDAAGEEARAWGEVEAILGDDGRPVPDLYAQARAVRVRVFDEDKARLRRDASARLVRVPQTGAWVLQTLLTKKTIPRIAEEWNQMMLAHRDEIFALVTPIARDLILDIERHVEREMPAFLARHREEVRALGERLEREVRGEDLPDLFEKEVWPLAQPRVRPILEKVSREVWENIPLWSFSWRIAYQALPFTENDHFERAWVRFLEAQAAPIVKSHSEEILEAVKQIARDAVSNPKVSARIRAAFTALIEHPSFHALTQVFLQEVFLDNPAFHDSLRARMRSPAVLRALHAASVHIEPMVRRMGDIVLGTRKDGVTREFARVLRAQILLKDLQRIVIRPGSDGSPPFDAARALQATVEWEGKE